MKKAILVLHYWFDVDYPILTILHRDLPFLPKKRVINIVNKLVCTFYDKKIAMSNLIIPTSFKTWLNF